MGSRPLIEAPRCVCGKLTFFTRADANLAVLVLSIAGMQGLNPYESCGVWHVTSRKPRSGPDKVEWYEYGNHRGKRRAQNKRWRKTEAGKACQKRYLAKKKRKKHLTRVAWALTALIDKLKTDPGGGAPE